MAITKIKNYFYNVPTRFTIALMVFLSGVFGFMMRANISVSILAMVEGRLINGTEQEQLPNYGPRYPWDDKQQSSILGSYFWGYFASTWWSGWITDVFGPTRAVGYGLFIISFLTILSPLAASHGFWYLWLIRFLIGVVSTPAFPAIQNFASKWSPLTEKGKFMATNMGFSLGTAIIWPLIGIIIEKIGWDWTFYIPAIITVIFTITWFLCVTDTPAEHPRISNNERDFIEKSLEDTVSKGKQRPPILRIFMSIPVIALNFLNFGQTWGFYLAFTETPKYLSQVLGFNLVKAGIFSALPFLLRIFIGLIFGIIGDKIVKKKIINTTALRNIFVIFSHIIPGLLLIGLMYAGENVYLCITLISLSVGFNGASSVTSNQNPQDLAPNFAGYISSFTISIGTTGGFLSPMVVAAFTADNHTAEEWKYVFLIGAIIYFIPSFIFFLFGSGEVQEWNKVEEIENDIKNQNETQIETYQYYSDRY